MAVIFRYTANICRRSRLFYCSNFLAMALVTYLFLTVINKQHKSTQRKKDSAAAVHKINLSSPHKRINSSNDKPSPISRSTYMAAANQSNTMQQITACNYPRLNPFNPDIMKRFKPFPPIICDKQPKWIKKLKDGKIKLSIPKEAKDQHGNISCTISYIFRQGDYQVKYSTRVQLHENSELKLKKDFFRLNCETNTTEQVHQSFHANIAYKAETHYLKQNTTAGLGYDIFMLGMDSVSHMHFIRKLPKTYQYFTEVMGGKVLNGYNIVGDGTPQALIPILTGHTETELPPTLRRLSNRQFVNVYPFIWKDLHNHGYATLFAEDLPEYGTFNYRMIGFSEQPTDHYMRPFHLSLWPDEINNNKRFCLGSSTRLNIFLDWLKDFYMMYEKQRKFSFGFYGELSHNTVDSVEAMDNDLVATLEDLNQGKQLSNTIFILFSDHGARYGDIRTTLQGKQEERLPFVGFVFPETFKKQHQQAFQNFKTNTKRLTTPFDMYETLKDMITFGGDGIGSTKDRGISLFKEIPNLRTCQQAHIAPHWCACQPWKEVDLSDTVVQQAAKEIVKHINNITLTFRNLCSLLELQTVTKALQAAPMSEMLHFKSTKDVDGLIPDLSDNTKTDHDMYQLWITTQPGGGTFETTVKHIKSGNNEFVIQTSSISRINKYGIAPACVEKTHEELRKYCFCK